MDKKTASNYLETATKHRTTDGLWHDDIDIAESHQFYLVERERIDCLAEAFIKNECTQVKSKPYQNALRARLVDFAMLCHGVDCKESTEVTRDGDFKSYKKDDAAVMIASRGLGNIATADEVIENEVIENEDDSIVTEPNRRLVVQDGNGKQEFKLLVPA